MFVIHMQVIVSDSTFVGEFTKKEPCWLTVSFACTVGCVVLISKSLKEFCRSGNDTNKPVKLGLFVQSDSNLKATYK